VGKFRTNWTRKMPRAADKAQRNPTRSAAKPESVRNPSIRGPVTPLRARHSAPGPSLRTGPVTLLIVSGDALVSTDAIGGGAGSNESGRADQSLSCTGRLRWDGSDGSGRLGFGPTEAAQGRGDGRDRLQALGRGPATLRRHSSAASYTASACLSRLGTVRHRWRGWVRVPCPARSPGNRISSKTLET
jgi:hypothetical protein